MKKNNKIIRVALDVDSVLRDLPYQLIQEYLKCFPYHREKIRPYNEWKDYNLSHHFPLGKDIFEFLYENPSIYLQAPMLPNAYNAIKALKKCGFYILVISSQPNELTQEWTNEWLKNHRVEPMELYYSQDKHNLIDTFDYLIDDNPLVIKNVFDAGGKVIIMNQPYNKQNLGLDIETNCFRANHWDEIVCFLLKDKLDEPQVRQLYNEFSHNKEEKMISLNQFDEKFFKPTQMKGL